MTAVVDRGWAMVVVHMAAMSVRKVRLDVRATNANVEEHATPVAGVVVVMMMTPPGVIVVVVMAPMAPVNMAPPRMAAVVDVSSSMVIAPVLDHDRASHVALGLA